MNLPTRRIIALAILVGLLAIAGAGLTASDVGRAVTFSCADDEATVAARGGPRATLGAATVYVGYRQVTANNQDPIVVKFSGGEQVWCRTDYEQTGVDGRAYGVLWDADGLYVVFSVDGGNYDFNFGTANGWLRSYGAGGGPKVAVISQLDPADGRPVHGTFLSAQLSNGNTNSLEVLDLCRVQDEIRVVANSWYSPRDVAGRRLTACEGSSPLDYVIAFRPDLTGASAVSSEACGVVDARIQRGCDVRPELAITVATRPHLVSAGDSVTGTVRFANIGQTAADSITVSVTLPVSFTLDSLLAAGVPLTESLAAPPHYVWTGGPLEPGAAGGITATGQISATAPPGFYTLRATIASADAAIAPTSHQISVGVDVLSYYLPLVLRH